MDILRLSEDLQNKISAGEVVERPSSVVKELLENSLDAGARQIDIVIEQGGNQLIQVRDNGIGIKKDQLPNAIKRFHTSKLSNLNDLFAIDTLGFKANKSYEEILEKVPNNKEAVDCFFGNIEKRKVVLCIMNFKFIGGSMGSAVGEKISKSISLASEKNCPLIILCQSGGARMQEGALSLMQLSKISTHLAKFSKKGGLYISILTYPTTGGVTASFGMQADVTIAEPKALIGFAGQRVIKQTTSQELPDHFQTSEFLKEKGFIDFVVDRKNLKNSISKVLDVLA